MQSRMMRWALVGLTFAFWRLALCQEQIAPDKTGVELINVLRAQFEATHTHSYKAARQQMFGHIDNDQGAVRLVYSGDQFETLTIPDHTVVNTEHTWPQSKFKHAVSGQRIKSDLHHLYPTRSRINSARGSKPFADIPDTQTEQWWRSSEPQDAIPDEARRAAFSESTNQAFEPREDHKGNVARSMFYIYAIYGDQALDLDWFRLQIDTLRRWHANDPVDASERARTLAIQDFQGNTNPFVLDPTLVERLFREPTERRPIRLISWNARELFSIDEVQLRAVDLRHFAEALRPDVLLLQKVTSQAVAEAVRDVMGLSGYEVVCSDFTQNDHNGHSSFEVAILSRFPLDDVVEFDRSLDNHSADEPVEQRLERVDLAGIAEVGVGRGFLQARIDELKLSLIVTHLKSSGRAVGEPDRSNAQKRELVAAAMARQVRHTLAADPELTALVAGDFNVGETDGQKLGHSLTEDCSAKDCSGQDRYDETHALLSAGLVDDVRMRSLTRAVGETYVSTEFVGTGPIDVLYVTGAEETRFPEAGKAEQPFGSDHLAVVVEVELP